MFTKANRMQTATLLLSVMLAVVLIAGCGGDSDTDSTPTGLNSSGSDLAGTYTGTYTITEFLDEESSVKKIQPVVWTFTESTYCMTIDTSVMFDRSFSVCCVEGKYMQAGTLKLTEELCVPDENAGFENCREKYNPSGEFTMDRSSDGISLKLTRLEKTENILKELTLTKGLLR